MKIIIPTGYMGSGSSAITNLLAEYEKVDVSHGDFEFCFIHCPNGLLDLEDKLFSNNNFIRSDEAIKSFRKEMKFLNKKQYYFLGNYYRIFNNKFLPITEDYINSITTIKFEGLWYNQERPNFITNFIKFCSKVIRRLLLRKIRLYTIKNYSHIELSLISKEEFYAATRKYINDLISEISNQPYVVLDQLLLPFNLYRIKSYFNDNAYPIVVTRDPRDVFVLNKYVWSKMNSQVPFSFNVKEFCKQYRLGRESEKQSEIEVLNIAFEDLVLNYEESVKKVEDFVGLDPTKHIRKKEIFNPDISIKNIAVYHNFPEAKDEIKIIEEELKDYLYTGSEIQVNEYSKKDLF